MAKQNVKSAAEVDQALHLAKIDKIAQQRTKKNGKPRNIFIEDGSDRLKLNETDII